MKKRRGSAIATREEHFFFYPGNKGLVDAPIKAKEKGMMEGGRSHFAVALPESG